MKKEELLELLRNSIDGYKGVNSSISEKKLWRTSGIDILHPFPDWRSWKRSPWILKGHNKNREYLKRSRAIYSRLIKNLFKNPNRYYNSTISDGIRAFFKLYDYRYLTHDYIITADDFKKRYDGRSVYLQYLYCIETENIFLNHFDSEDVSSLLESLKEDYIDIPFTLAECVFVNWLFDFKSGKQIIEQYEKLSKEDLLTGLRHKLNISHLSYR